jgi:2-oxoglutarate ferredoxin oxidoreductase subunit alpha
MTNMSARAAAIRVNDFVVKFANVNGSGSASANGLFARAILRMGVPVSARNIFPSNSQGLPTWYEVRVNEAGWRASRWRRPDGRDEPADVDKDVAEIDSGGVLFYDSTRRSRPASCATTSPWSGCRSPPYATPNTRSAAATAVQAIYLARSQHPRHRRGRNRSSSPSRQREKRSSNRIARRWRWRDYALANFECPLPIRAPRKCGGRAHFHRR